MAASAEISVRGLVSGTPTGNKTIGPLTAISAAANGYTLQVVLGLNANTITVPTVPATTGCVIQLPAASTAVVTLKGAAADTGIAIGKVGWCVLTWDPTAAPANFVLNSSAGQTRETEISFF